MSENLEYKRRCWTCGTVRGYSDRKCPKCGEQLSDIFKNPDYDPVKIYGKSYHRVYEGFAEYEREENRK